MKMQLMEEDDDLAYGASPDDEDKVMADGRPAWMRTLHTSVSTWMSLIPKVAIQTFLHVHYVDI